MDSDDKADSSNLRDFLRKKEDDNNYYGGRSQTLGRALSDGKRGGAGPPERIQSIRTLLDVIRDDPAPGGNAKDGKKSWKYIKDKLRLRRQGSGSSWTSSVPVPTSDVPINQNNSRSMSRRDSIRMNMPVSDGSSNMVVEMSPGSGLPRTRSAMFQRNASRAVGRESLRYDSYTYNNNNNNNEPEEADEEVEGAAGDSTEEEATGEAEDGGGGGGGGESGGGGGEQQPAVRMSLMALLAETDRQMGIDGLAAFTMADDDDEEEEEEEKGGGGEYSACCVCMVRHKGAAFIPCGHTFCRLCSRELWVQRGNCPLCNNFILEILDIF